MASISFGGLGNGLDFGQVVDQLVKVQRLPIDQLSQKKATAQSKLTDYALLGGKLQALQSAGDALRLPTAFDRTSTTVSDETALTASGVIDGDVRNLPRPGDAIGTVASSDQQRSHSRIERDFRYCQRRLGLIYLPRRNGDQSDRGVERYRYARRLAERH